MANAFNYPTFEEYSTMLDKLNFRTESDNGFVNKDGLELSYKIELMDDIHGMAFQMQMFIRGEEGQWHTRSSSDDDENKEMATWWLRHKSDVWNNQDDAKRFKRATFKSMIDEQIIQSK